jgi:hypothetical protein
MCCGWPLLPAARVFDTAVSRAEADAAVAASLARAAGAIARLDQALAFHPLLPAVLYRARLEAARRAAAVDGNGIDPWHLAAVLEGLRLRMDPGLAMRDRGSIFDAARHAFDQYQWLVTPDFDQEGAVQAAEKVLAAAPGATPLLAGANGLHAWIGGDGHSGGNGHGDGGGDRRAGRAALIRFWQREKLLRMPFPLIAAASLRADIAWAPAAWIPGFLTALAEEAADGLQLLQTLERAWFAARSQAAGRRSTSRAGAAIDVLAAAPLVSATSLGKALGMATQNATALLDRFCADGIALEVTHRSKRRLYGLTALAPLRDGVAPPRRPEPGRGRGRPPILPVEDVIDDPPPPLPPLTPLQRGSIDYSGLDAAMEFADAAMRNARRAFGQLRPGPRLPAEAPEGDAEGAASDSGETPGDSLGPSHDPVDDADS